MEKQNRRGKNHAIKYDKDIELFGCDWDFGECGAGFNSIKK